MHLTTKRSLARRKAIVALTKKGATVAEIADQLDLTKDCVYVHLRRARVKPVRPKMLTTLANRKRVTSAVTRLGVAGAANRFKVTRQAIYARLADWGLSVDDLRKDSA